MLLQYFHESALAGHFGARKTFLKFAANFWWPRMGTQIFDYLRLVPEG
jgi:hypothetical protein